MLDQLERVQKQNAELAAQLSKLQEENAALRCQLATGVPMVHQPYSLTSLPPTHSTARPRTPPAVSGPEEDHDMSPSNTPDVKRTRVQPGVTHLDAGTSSVPGLGISPGHGLY